MVYDPEESAALYFEAGLVVASHAFDHKPARCALCEREGTIGEDISIVPGPTAPGPFEQVTLYARCSDVRACHARELAALEAEEF